MNWKRCGLSLVGIGVLALVAACGSGTSGGSSTATLTWGLITPFSGPAATYGPPEKAADQAAIDRINSEGGIRVGNVTYTLALKTYDSAYDPTTAVTATRQAVNQDHLKFLEVLGGGIVPAVQPITDPAKVMVFAIAGGDSYLGTKHPLTFRPYYDIPASSESNLRYLKGVLGKSQAKVVFFLTDDDLGHSVSGKETTRAQSLGYETSTVFVGRDATDFSATLTQVLAQHPDVIDFGATPSSQYAIAVKQARQLGYTGTFSFPDTFDSTTVGQAGGLTATTGSVTAPAWQSFDTPEGQYWTSKMKTLGQDPIANNWTAQAYDNLLLFRAAVEKAGSLDTSAVATALGQVSVTGALGQVKYGGQSTYGLPGVFIIPYPVAKIASDGSLTVVAAGQPT